MFAFFGTNDSEDLVLILILKYSSSQITLILKLNIIHQKMVMILFKKISHGTSEEAKTVFLYFSSELSVLDWIVIAHRISADLFDYFD
jgi:hypothetical protein